VFASSKGNFYKRSAPQMVKMVEVSRNVVAILLVLVVLVSGLGTYSLLTREQTDTTAFSGGNTPGAAVALEVVPRTDTGVVQLDVASPPQ
jgi:hypothetical protein